MVAEVIVDVLNTNVDRVFDYAIPEGKEIVEGARVLVPFATKLVEGFVIATKPCSSFEGELKEIKGELDLIPALTPELIRLAVQIKNKYHVLLAEALRLFIPAEMRGGKVEQKTKNYVRISENVDLGVLTKTLSRAPKQREALLYLTEHGEAPLSFLAVAFGRGAINALKERGAVCIYEQGVQRIPYKAVSGHGKSVTLTYEQNAVLQKIISNQGKSFLLHGVTGSGKTEIYIRAIKNALEQGKTAIMLVPEIGLTPQVMRRFRSEFGESVALLHSGLSAGERYDEWWRLRNGEAKVAVGARSAIFAPLENLGLIVIDEEHEQSYNSDKSPRYRTEEVARMRSLQTNATLIKGSATPLIESYYRAKSGEDILLELKDRINYVSMPEAIVVDMRNEVMRGNDSVFSEELIYRLEQTLSHGEQAMLYINRRGFSPVVMCNACGYVARCKDCDVSLTYHKEDEQLKCHYCGAKYRVLDVCPECGSAKIRQRGLGTEKVVNELQKRFPSARFLRMDADTTKNKDGHARITEAFFKGEADILVGTQMIAKGHDFANVTLVGVLDADLGLYLSDFRAAERTFSLLTQVAGRAGRAQKKGYVVLQTHTPHHPLVRLAKDYDYHSFYEHEILLREAAKYPPFGSIIRVMVVAEKEEEGIAALKELYSKLLTFKQKHEKSFVFFNKMKSPVKFIMKKYRFQVLMRVFGNDTDAIIDGVYTIVDECKKKGVTVYTEINPGNLS